jgi:hypothetical protein
MCCCGKPTINGELGYKWQPDDAPSTRPVDPPDVADDETILYDEPGRCGGLDHHAHHFRVVQWYSSLFLLVRHGGGDERMRLFPHKRLAAMLANMDSDTRYWILAAIYDAYSDGQTAGRETERTTWSRAAVEGRIKTRKQRNSNTVKVHIEPATV